MDWCRWGESVYEADEVSDSNRFKEGSVFFLPRMQHSSNAEDNIHADFNRGVSSPIEMNGCATLHFSFSNL
eukprot:scaffold3893_cov89-Skeletonema_dohrnii-CCMP3373.AAC.6